MAPRQLLACVAAVLLLLVAVARTQTTDRVYWQSRVPQHARDQGNLQLSSADYRGYNKKDLFVLNNVASGQAPMAIDINGLIYMALYNQTTGTSDIVTFYQSGVRAPVTYYGAGDVRDLKVVMNNPTALVCNDGNGGSNSLLKAQKRDSCSNGASVVVFNYGQPPYTVFSVNSSVLALPRSFDMCHYFWKCDVSLVISGRSPSGAEVVVVGDITNREVSKVHTLPKNVDEVSGAYISYDKIFTLFSINNGKSKTVYLNQFTGSKRETLCSWEVDGKAHLSTAITGNQRGGYLFFPLGQNLHSYPVGIDNDCGTDIVTDLKGHVEHLTTWDFEI
ncbi:hypothetical protein QOT17_025366 [Balamuthia mandrillaris]